jgi:hypothetical protein
LESRNIGHHHHNGTTFVLIKLEMAHALPGVKIVFFQAVRRGRMAGPCMWRGPPHDTPPAA